MKWMLTLMSRLLVLHLIQNAFLLHSLIPIEKKDDFLSHSRLKTGKSFNQYLTITLSLKLTIEIHDWKLEQNTFGSSNFYNLTSYPLIRRKNMLS